MQTTLSAAQAQTLLDRRETKEPWRTFPSKLQPGRYTVRVEKGPVLAVSQHPGDAHLIAAAPELAASVVALHAEVASLKAQLDRLEK